MVLIPAPTPPGSKEWRTALNETIRNELGVFQQRISTLADPHVGLGATKSQEPGVMLWQQELKALATAIDCELRRFTTAHALHSAVNTPADFESGMDIPPWLVVVRTGQKSQSRPQTSDSAMSGGGAQTPRRPHGRQMPELGSTYSSRPVSPRDGMRPISRGSNSARGYGERSTLSAMPMQGRPQSRGGYSDVGGESISGTAQANTEMVGDDAAAVALNAAALQTLSHRPPEAPLVRINKGSIYWSQRPALLDGAESSDVSYLADEAGHGLQVADSSRKARSRVVPLPWQKQLSLLGRLHVTEHTNRNAPSPHAPDGFARGTPPQRDGAAAVPSSRAEAVATAAKLRRDLQWLETQVLESEERIVPICGTYRYIYSYDETYPPQVLESEEAKMRAEVALWDETFEELVRQVAVHCSERGRVLHSVRERHNKLFHRLIELRESELEKARAQARAAQQQLANRSSTADQTSKLSQTALLLTRAAGRASIEKEKQKLASMSEPLDKRLQTLREDLEQANTYRKVLEKQLTEARELADDYRRRMEDLSVEDLTELIENLDAMDHTMLLRAGLKMRQQGVLRGALPETQTTIMQALLRPLEPDDRCDLLVDTMSKLHVTARLAGISKLMQGLSGEEVGALLASQVVQPLLNPAATAKRRQTIARTLLHAVGGKMSLEHTAPELHAELPERVKGGDTKPLEEAIAQLQKRLKDKEDSLADARHKQADAESSRDVLQNEVNTLRAQLDSARHAAQDSLTTSASALEKMKWFQDQTNKAQRENEKYVARIKQLEVQLEIDAKMADAQLRTMTQERDRLEAELSRVKNELLDLQEEAAEGEVAAERSTEQIEAAEQRAAELAEMARIQKLESEAVLRALQEQIDQQRKAAEAREGQVQQEIDELQNLVGMHRVEVKDYELQIDGLRERLEAGARGANERDQERAGMEARLAQLQEEVSTQEMRNAAGDEKCSALEAQVQQLKDDVKAQAEGGQAQVQAMAQEAEDIARAKSERSKENELAFSLERSVAKQYRQQLHSANSKLDELSGQLADLQKRHDAAHGRHQLLLETKEARIEELLVEIAQLKRDASAAPAETSPPAASPAACEPTEATPVRTSLFQDKSLSKAPTPAKPTMLSRASSSGRVMAPPQRSATMSQLPVLMANEEGGGLDITVTLGSMELQTKGAKAMSLTFLYRMVSSLTAARITYGLTQRKQGTKTGGLEGVQIIEDVQMPDFVVMQTLSYYGVQKLAKRYLEEMIVGLHKERQTSLRLSFFAESIGVFSQLMSSERHGLMIETLQITIGLMDAERALSRVRRDQFFQKFGECTDLFLPFSYLERGLHEALESEQEEMIKFIALGMTPDRNPNLRVHNNERECIMAAKENKVVRRGVVLGKHLDGGFVSIDNFLQCLGETHAEYARVRRQKVTKLFRKYDENKDGVFSLSEFSRMLEALMPSLRKDQAQQLWYSCLKSSGEEAGITPDDLEHMMYGLERRHRAAVLQERAASSSAAAVSHEEATADVWYMADLWDKVKDTADLAKFEFYLENWSLMIRLQAQFRGLLARIRKRKAAEAASPEAAEVEGPG